MRRVPWHEHLVRLSAAEADVFSDDDARARFDAPKHAWVLREKTGYRSLDTCDRSDVDILVTWPPVPEPAVNAA